MSSDSKGSKTQKNKIGEQDQVSSSTTSNKAKLNEGPISSSLNNPFARTPPQSSWAQDSSESKPILAPPKLAPPDSGVPVLRPSALGQSSRSTSESTSLFSGASNSNVTFGSLIMKSSFQLKPSALSSGSISNNPFAKVPISIDDTPADSTSTNSENKQSQNGLPSLPNSGNDLWKTDVSSSTESNKEKETPVNTSKETSSTNTSASLPSSSSSMFVPLNINNGSSNSNSSITTSSKSTMNGLASPSGPNMSFIFGQNLQERVTDPDKGSSDVSTNGEADQTNLFTAAASAVPTDSSNSFSAASNLFSEAASGLSKGSEDNAWSSGKSLDESSRELTEKENSQKRKFEEVEVVTGEESESNVLQMNCKLYQFVSGAWQERGRGILRLNDWGTRSDLHSRIVIRTHGTLTVMLNAQVWSGMTVERAGQKSVRFTASDTDGQPKIFLVTGSPKEVDLLYNSLEWRVVSSRSKSQEDGEQLNSKKTKTDDESTTSKPPPYCEPNDHPS